jgi:hypothetical protein
MKKIIKLLFSEEGEIHEIARLPSDITNDQLEESYAGDCRPKGVKHTVVSRSFISSFPQWDKPNNTIIYVDDNNHLMYTCTAVERKLKTAKLNGHQSIIVESLTDDDINDLRECGFFVKKKVIGEEESFIVSETDMFTM